MKTDVRICKEYCTGCGWCHDVLGCDLILESNGFREIDASNITKENLEILKKVCPAFGTQCDIMDERQLWGRRKSIYTAYASNNYVRFRASSGGVLTQLACYLIESKLVDGVIHIGKDENDPIGSKLFCSRTSQEVISHCGSRYTSSAPFDGIKEYLDNNEKYCFIGKPCDVAVLRNWESVDGSVGEKFPYVLSFFCAGAPSRNVNIKLLDKMGCPYETCVDLDYRGNGWPGYATAMDKDGENHKILYREAWGQTLGRDIRKSCRFCVDGIGEMADVSCCDAWYLDNQKKPSFEEHDGRNAVFCRTNKGKKLFEDASSAGYINIIDYPKLEEELQFAQYHQFFKKGSMYSSILAMKVMMKPCPKYDLKKLRVISKNISNKLKVRKFGGTIKRIIQGKI